jgi:GntR family transcriptional regulator, transcriptional repressor for pyruvate dehydrogenase complex
MVEEVMQPPASKKNKPPTALHRRETLTSQLVRALTARINDGDLKPGDRLPTEQDLIEAFAVSRTVVREAISSLKATGLVTTQQGVGAFVREPPPVPLQTSVVNLELLHDVIQVLELRIGVEVEAAALAAQRREVHHVEGMRDAITRMGEAIEGASDTIEPDLVFHRLIAEATGNPHFTHLFSYLGALLIPRTRVETYRFTPEDRQAYLHRVNREHQAIFQAVERRDVDGACSAMRMHLSNSRDRLRKAV